MSRRSKSRFKCSRYNPTAATVFLNFLTQFFPWRWCTHWPFNLIWRKTTLASVYISASPNIFNSFTPTLDATPIRCVSSGIEHPENSTSQSTSPNRVSSCSPMSQDVSGNNIALAAYQVLDKNIQASYLSKIIGKCRRYNVLLSNHFRNLPSNWCYCQQQSNRLQCLSRHPKSYYIT